MNHRALLVASLAAASFARPALAATCESLASLTPKHVTISVAESLSGSFTPPGSTTPITGLPPFCRVAGFSTPGPDSHISFEVWMPTSWPSRRYQQVGNGGFAGAIPYGSLAAALRTGFATAGTDDGHVGGTATWAPGHHQKIIDFGFRALKETTDAAKAIIAAFYGNGPDRSYFVGCSDGGREALMEAQRFPEDFDGIVAGAPANDWTHLFSGFIFNEQAQFTDPSGASNIPPAALQVLQTAALEQCDDLDGVHDGIVNDPRQCRFDPIVVECGRRGVDPGACLTPAQVAAARAIYAGPTNPRTGAQVFPGYEAGAEAAPGGWQVWITGPFPFAGSPTIQSFFGNQFFTYIVFEDPAFDFRKFNLDTDVAFADYTAATTINSTVPDLSRFRAHGGKLLQWHGWDDPAIAPRSSIDYFERVVDAQGNLHRTQEFYRLFLLPGVLHCGGGPGPNVFDFVTPLVSWVETGRAPDRVIATKFVGDNPANGVQMTRPICSFPDFAEHVGNKDPNAASSFICRPHNGGDH